MLHAFGGALALAWCVEEPRATNDIDLNVFVPAAEFGSVLAALPAGIEVSGQSRRRLADEGQARLWWSRVPLDVFLTSDPFHTEVATRIVRRDFAGESLPFLHCRDLAVFKSFFDRGKDWQDIGEMVRAGSLDALELADQLAELLGPNDHRVARVQRLHQEVESAQSEEW
ncbi:MAG: hypothetical protein OXG55_15355 [bacterium]|nr:hypothetical protein [bacterium]